MHGSRAGRDAGQLLLVAVLYALAGFLMLSTARFTGLAAPVWPAAGLAFAAVYARGRYLAFGVAVGSFVVNATTIQRGEVSSTALVVTAAVIALGAALQALAGGGLVRRFVGVDLALDSPGQILAFLTLAGPVACIVNASFGVAVQLVTGVIPNLARLVLSPVWGHLFDHMNFFALRVTLNVGFAIGIFTFFTSNSFAGLVTGAIVFGISNAGGDVAWSLWVTKFAPPGRVADYMSVHTFLTGVRGVAAPLFAFYFAAKVSLMSLMPSASRRLATKSAIVLTPRAASAAISSSIGSVWAPSTSER